jgi:hypothetical protein
MWIESLTSRGSRVSWWLRLDVALNTEYQAVCAADITDATGGHARMSIGRLCAFNDELQ